MYSQGVKTKLSLEQPHERVSCDVWKLCDVFGEDQNKISGKSAEYS